MSRKARSQTFVGDDDSILWKMGGDEIVLSGPVL
jgi:hypothetical protein